MSRTLQAALAALLAASPLVAAGAEQGDLELRTEPGAVVVWEGVELGRADARGVLLIRDIPPASYRIELRKPGFRAREAVVDVTPGERTLSLPLERLAPPVAPPKAKPAGPISPPEQAPTGPSEKAAPESASAEPPRSAPETGAGGAGPSEVRPVPEARQEEPQRSVREALPGGRSPAVPPVPEAREAAPRRSAPAEVPSEPEPAATRPSPEAQEPAPRRTAPEMSPPGGPESAAAVVEPGSPPPPPHEPAAEAVPAGGDPSATRPAPAAPAAPPEEAGAGRSALPLLALASGGALLAAWGLIGRRRRTRRRRRAVEPRESAGPVRVAAAGRQESPRFLDDLRRREEALDEYLRLASGRGGTRVVEVEVVDSRRLEEDS